MAEELKVHPSHDMWYRYPDSGECNNCGLCTCCDPWSMAEEPCKSVPTKEKTMGALKGVELIKKERVRQIAVEGYSVEGDEGRGIDLMRAGNCYQQYAMMQHELDPEGLVAAGHPSDIPWADGKSLWPWARDLWKPSDDPTRNLIKGAALMAAALDVL